MRAKPAFPEAIPQPRSEKLRCPQSWLPIALFATLWLDLIWQLSYQRSTNDQDGYDWFVCSFTAALGACRGMGQQTLQIITSGYNSPSQAEQAVRHRLPQVIRPEPPPSEGSGH